MQSDGLYQPIHLYYYTNSVLEVTLRWQLTRHKTLLKLFIQCRALLKKLHHKALVDIHLLVNTCFDTVLLQSQSTLK